jgi:hypothetical protein
LNLKISGNLKIVFSLIVFSLKIFIILIGFVSVNSYGKSPLQCSTLFFEIESNPQRVATFENGHNVPLRNIMLKMREYESTVVDFIEGLNPVMASRFVKDDSQKYRNLQALEKTLDIAKKYERILTHLVEHADNMLMTSKIERIPPEKRQEFIRNYKMAYVDYLATYQKLVAQLELFQSQDPATWDNEISREILRDLNNQMGNAHNRF